MRLNHISPEMIARAPSMVAALVKRRNAHEPFPAEITFGGRTYSTRAFLGEVIPFNPPLGELAPGDACLDGVAHNATDLSGEALTVLDIATKEGLLAPASAASARPDPWSTVKADPVAALRAAGVEARYVSPKAAEPEIYQPPKQRPQQPVPEWDPNGAAFARQNTAEAIAARKLSAEQEAEVAAFLAGTADARRVYTESTNRPRAFAAPVEPQAAPSGVFDRESFHDQTAS